MIYTCTLNPSLDYFMEFDKVELGKTNRSSLEYYEAGGKGINVSIVLNNLMIPSRALGFVGGFTKDFFISLLQKYEYIEPVFTFIEGHTRINVKVKGDLLETELNAKGPSITEEDMRMMLRRVERLNRSDIFVLSGNCPDNLVDLTEKMIQLCIENDVKFVLDVNHELLLRLLKYKPFLVRPNIEDLETMFDEVIADQKQLIHAGRRCVELGAENVILMMGKDGSLLINQDGVYHANSIDAEVVNSVGAADSMIAGFVMNYLRSRDIITTFKYANCCGIATAFSKGMATREKIESLYDEILVTKIDENEEA